MTDDGAARADIERRNITRVHAQHRNIYHCRHYDPLFVAFGLSPQCQLRSLRTAGPASSSRLVASHEPTGLCTALCDPIEGRLQQRRMMRPVRSVGTINSRSHLQMSAEPIPVSDRARGCPRALMKIHKAKGGAIFLKRDARRMRARKPRRAAGNLMHGFQGVDESRGIAEWSARGVILVCVGFFYRADARSRCGIGISRSLATLSA